VLAVDVHNLAAFENAFRCGIDHLEAKKLFTDYFASLLKDESIAIVSPDVGGVKRAEQLRQALSRRLAREIGNALLEKYRSGGQVTGEAVVGDVDGKVVIIIDDLISTGGTISRAANACRQRGARTIFAAASHGIFVGDAARVIAGAGVERLVITDTIPPFRLDPAFVQEKVTILETAPFIAEAIQRIHGGGSIVDLLEV